MALAPTEYLSDKPINHKPPQKRPRGMCGTPRVLTPTLGNGGGNKKWANKSK